MATRQDREYCMGCVHYWNRAGAENECCLYILDTHKRRGCKGGKGCDKWSNNPHDILYGPQDDKKEEEW